MEAFLIFGVFILVLLVFLSTGVPVAAAMGIIGMIGSALFISPNAIVQLSSIAFSQSTSFVLIVIPLFVWMGEILASSSIGHQLFVTAQRWLNRLPGSLAIGTIVACAGFASICGSSPVTAATIGSFAVPEMEKQGYNKRLALGVTAAGGTLGILIPPSIPMILYGILTETSIGKLFIAGILPGLMMTVLLSITVGIMIWRNPSLAPKVQSYSWNERFSSLASVIPIIVLIALILGVIYLGIATPTESAAVGVAGALIILLVMRQFKWKQILSSLNSTVKTTAMFLLLLVGGLFSTFVLNRIGVPQGMASFIMDLPLEPWMIIICINLLLIVMGMFLDPMSILVIVVPIFFPAVQAMGYDPIWFGIMMTITIEIAAITPPVGFNLFVLKSVTKDTNLGDVIQGAFPFVIPLILGILLILMFPQIVLWLPSFM